MKRLIIALAMIAVPVAAKPSDKEPIIAVYQGDAAADVVAAACIERGWVVSDRTEFELKCADREADPPPAATFMFVQSKGGTIIQVTTKVWVTSNIYSQSSSLARKARELLTGIGAVPKS